MIDSYPCRQLKHALIRTVSVRGFKYVPTLGTIQELILINACLELCAINNTRLHAFHSLHAL